MAGSSLSSVKMVLDTIGLQETAGIPTGNCYLMEHGFIERIAGKQPGDYFKNPEATYLACQKNIGVCLIDQYIPRNPLTMAQHGYQNAVLGATTGAENIVCDGMTIDSPEAVVEHLEKFTFPRLREALVSFDETARVREILETERAVQRELGPEIVKTGYGFIQFPCFRYYQYGYANYFMAYGLYPEIMEKDFSLQADLAVLNNRAAARAYAEGGLPPLYRLDHDMADARGTLVSMQSLDSIWFPHFTRALAPMLRTNVRMIWHCDGNLMQMVPRLLEAGVKGFQGFQYEDGMDYKKICRMKAKDGDGLFIMGGVSVTRTLPRGTPDEVKNEIDWLVANGPRTGLVLMTSSSLTPGAPWENVKTMIDGFQYYREHGRK